MADTDRYRIFICYALADADWVNGYLIAELGLPREQVITPEDFPLGAKIPDEFARALTTSEYTLLIITPAFLVAPETADATSVANYQRIINKEKRLIPLLLKPADLPLQIDFLLRLDCTEISHQKSQIERLRQALNTPPPPVLPPPPCPYPGMKPFTSHDKYFYGRDNEIDDLLTRVRYHRQIFIIGGSGSGKSSLVFAGLLPKLAAQADPKWYVCSLRPGDDPPSRLTEALGTKLPLSLDQLPSIVSERLKNQGDKLLLIIDQLEEAFAQSDKEKQTAFYAILNALIPLDNCVTIFTVRADFMGHLINSPLKTDAKSQMQIAPLQNAAMRDALVKPARAVGVWLDDRLVEQMIVDAADEPGCMPMLQETMRMLWDRLEHRYLPFETYQALGKDGRSGLAEAMAQKANAVLQELRFKVAESAPKLAERMFLRLVQFGDGDNAPVTRRQQTFDQLKSDRDDPTIFQRTLQYLIDNRLLVSDDDDDPSVISGKGQYVTISHEMLLIKWPAAEAWIKQGRQDELFRRELVRDALAWENCVPAARSHEFLIYQGSRLERLLNWAKLHPNDINALERRFLDANVQKERDQQRKRTLTFTTIGLLITAVAIIGGLAGFDTLTRESNARATRELQENLHQQAINENPFVDSAGGVQREEVSFEQYAWCSQAQPTLCSPLPIEVIDPQLPVTDIDPYQASAYCRWVGGVLPTVQQWLQAAIGYGTATQRAWPWDDMRLPNSILVNARTDLEPNFQPSGPAMTNSSEFSAGSTPEGLHHMFGNVREWTRTIFEPGQSPVSADASLWNGNDPLNGDLKLHAVGYSWQTVIYTSLTDQFGFPRELVGEFGTSPDGLPDIGFRCVRADVGQ